MKAAKIYVTPVLDCVTQTASLTRLSIQTREGQQLARPFKSFPDLRNELLRVGLLTDQLNDLEQNLGSQLSWQSANSLAISLRQIEQLKLRPCN